MKKVLRRGVDVQFVCANCGSSHYGSSTVNGANGDWDKGLIERHCHGSRGCPSFPIADDYKHFTVNGKRYATQAEFEAIVYTKRGAPDAAVGTGTTLLLTAPKSRGKSWLP
jgi:hypothetical protein